MEEMGFTVNFGKRKKTAIIVFIALILIACIALVFYLRYKSMYISTDDAFITGHIHTISSKVFGTVKKVYVVDNQFVKKGELLADIDPQDYDVKVKEASSAFDAEDARLAEVKYKFDASKQQYEELKSAIGAAKANLELQESNLKQAETDLKRSEELFKESLIPKERYEKTKTAYDVSNAQVRAAKENLIQTEARSGTQKALIKQAQAAIEPQKALIKQKQASLKLSELNLNYTKLYAPADGYVAKKSVEEGNQIQPGQPLMAVVPLNDIWIIANYKETQLDKVKPGQSVDIKVDTYSERVFKGKVESIMAGTGAVFSLFPPENATGNYIKIVQRIPVKIALDKDTDKDHMLRIGMSVVPTINTGK
jgi:membrane fusion protein (multidrug efflux system)